jgi:transposase, IS30 family
MVMFSERMRGGDAAVLGRAGPRGVHHPGGRVGRDLSVKGKRLMAATGGIRPRRGRNLKGRCLTFAEREEIALRRAAGESIRCIARWLGRSPSTASRELRRNADRRGGYRATAAHALAWERASRPKPAKLHLNRRRREIVETHLARRYSS